MEVVSTSRDIGVYRLLGGTEVEGVFEILSGSAVRYLPFSGRPFEHPTKLAGSPAEIEDDCRRLKASDLDRGGQQHPNRTVFMIRLEAHAESRPRFIQFIKKSLPLMSIARQVGVLLDLWANCASSLWRQVRWFIDELIDVGA
jgi:hypothetical protein